MFYEEIKSIINSIRNGKSYDNYCYYVRKFKKSVFNLIGGGGGLYNEEIKYVR